MKNYKNNNKQMSKHEFRKEITLKNETDIYHKLEYSKKKYKID